jgi:lipopolysaccharide export system permease protein
LTAYQVRAMRSGLRVGVSSVVPLLDRYVAREVASHARGAFVIVLAIFLVTRLSTLLSDAAVGSLPGRVLALLLGLRTLMALPSLLPAVLYLGVLLAMNRLSRDRELLAMETSGVTPGRLERAVLGLAVGAAAGIALLSFNGRPWAAARFDQVRDQAIADSGLDNVTPGIFYNLQTAAREVVFAESRSATDPEYLENVFVQRRSETGIAVFSARRAIELRDPAAGLRNLILEDGTQYDLDPDGEKHTVTQFERLSMQVPMAPSDPDLGPEKSLSVGALTATHDPEAVAELQWRIAMPISALLLCLLAVPLGRTDPRHARAARVFLAALLYVTYRTLLGTARSWVADGVLPPLPGLWLVHGACLLVALGLGRAQRTVSG